MRMHSANDAVRNARSRSIAKALAAFDPAASRRGRVRTQARRALIARNGLVSTADVIGWAYPRGERHHWQFEVVREALAKLGAKPFGRSGGRGRPIIWAL